MIGLHHNYDDNLDPPELPYGKPDGFKCADCGLFYEHPDSAQGWCESLRDYVYETDEDGCDDFVLRL